MQRYLLFIVIHSSTMRFRERAERFFPRFWGLLLATTLILYAGLSVYQINLPGLHYDEAFEAVPALQLLLNQPVTAFRNASLTLGQQNLPLMTQDYIGALNTYLAIPFIALFGATSTALRAMSILVGIITLALTYALAQRLTGTLWTGLAAVLLLSVDPTFVFWNRQGIFVSGVTAAIGVGATYCWVRRFQAGSYRWSIAGAFLFGLGIYAKLLFVWLIAALIGAVFLLNLSRLVWLVWHRSELTRLARRISPSETMVALLAFLLGCWPLILYNLQTSGTVLSITQNASTSYYGVDNLAIGSNLLERMRQFIILLNGKHLWYLGDVRGSSWGPILCGLVLFFVVILAIRNILSRDDSPPSWRYAQPDTRTFSPAKTALFPYLVIGLVILASVGTVSALWITHFAILMPWPVLAITMGSWFIALNLESATRRLNDLFKFALWTGLGLLFLVNLFNTLQYHMVLNQSGGLGSHSDAVYDLSEWLMLKAEGNVVAMDWGLAAPVTFLSHGQVTATEVFGYRWESDAELLDRLRTSIAQPNTLYLWRAPDEIIFDRSDEFKALYRPLNLEENIEEAFYEKSGRPILGVTRLVQKGTASNPPQ